MSERTHYVYRCYDADGQCLYVGCTNNLPRRMKEHRHEMSGADLAVSIKATGPFPRKQALALEKETAGREKPLWGMTPERQLLVARGLMSWTEIYPPHRRPRREAPMLAWMATA